MRGGAGEQAVTLGGEGEELGRVGVSGRLSRLIEGAKIVEVLVVGKGVFKVARSSPAVTGVPGARLRWVRVPSDGVRMSST